MLTIVPVLADDGNRYNRDGCSGLCTVEPGHRCTEDDDGFSTCTPDMPISCPNVSP